MVSHNSYLTITENRSVWQTLGGFCFGVLVCHHNYMGLVYITTKGIFVIESKNYSGYIFGDDRYRNWTSTLYAGKTWYGAKKVEKNQFYNPVKQNYAHIKALESYIGHFNSFSIIVFGNRAVLKNITVTSPGICVCNARDLNRFVKRIWYSVPDIYSLAQVQSIYNKLLPLTYADSTIKTLHIQNMHQPLRNDICPWCGGMLVERTAQRGKHAGDKFWGCSNYPKCKYIRNN